MRQQFRNFLRNQSMSSKAATCWLRTGRAAEHARAFSISEERGVLRKCFHARTKHMFPQSTQFVARCSSFTVPLHKLSSKAPPPALEALDWLSEDGGPLQVSFNRFPPIFKRTLFLVFFSNQQFTFEFSAAVIRCIFYRFLLSLSISLGWRSDSRTLGETIDKLRYARGKPTPKV